MATFDFEDDNGCVPAHKHANANGGDEGGWVADTAHVADTAYVGKNARVYGAAQVCGDARVCDDALVYGDVKVAK